METANFADRLAEAVTRKRSQLAVGLDPRLDLLPMELRGEAVLGRAAAASSLARFCKGIVDAVGPYVVAVKPQSAFFEALGSDGVRALEEVCDYARSAGLLVLARREAWRHRLDLARVRGRVSRTARRGRATRRRDDREPVHGARLGRAVPRSLPPPRLGRLLPLRNSNAGAADIQDLALSDGRPLWHHVAELLREWGEQLVGEEGMSSVGAIVGATYPRAVSEARHLLPTSPMLLLGVGAQGATPADVARAFTAGPASAIVSVSRSVIYAYRDSEADWREAAAAEAQRLAAQVWAAAGW